MPDKIITCKDCTAEFTFEEGEQTFYASKGLKTPRRCKECRTKRKFSSASAAPDSPSANNDNLL